MKSTSQKVQEEFSDKVQQMEQRLTDFTAQYSALFAEARTSAAEQLKQDLDNYSIESLGQLNAARQEMSDKLEALRTQAQQADAISRDHSKLCSSCWYEPFTRYIAQLVSGE